MPFIQKLKSTVKKYGLIQKNDAVLAGVSGGPDSLALLYALCCLKNEYSLKIYIAHLDHGLRKDSSSDALFVKSIAEKLKLPAIICKAHPSLSANKGSLEEAARNARIDFLCKLSRKLKADKIALGHNFNDQAETVLMRLIRGAGLYGLSGIWAKRKIFGCIFIRPLLEISRKEIESYVRNKNIRARIDPTNKEEMFFRNKIRNKLLPLLIKEYNANMLEILNNLADTASIDYDYLYCQARKAARSFNNSIDLKKLAKLHPAIQRLVLRTVLSRLSGNTRRLNLQHIKELEDLIQNRPSNSVVDLPKGIFALKSGNFLKFRRR